MCAIRDDIPPIAQDTCLNLARDLVGQPSLDQITGALNQAGRVGIGSTYCGLHVAAHGGLPAVMLCSNGETPVLAAPTQMQPPLDQGPGGPVVVDIDAVLRYTGCCLPEAIEDSGNVLLVPLTTDTRPLGFFMLSGKPEGFTEQDRCLAGEFAGLVAPAAQAARTRQLGEQRLCSVLAEADRLKNEFLANMSHEIRTPLNGIVGITELLRDTEPTSEQLEYIDLVCQSSETLLQLANNILDFATIQKQSVRLETTPFSLQALVASVGELQLPRARNKGLDLEICIDDRIPPVLRGDPGKVRQILTNLVGNAIKFTDTGTVRVECLPAGAPNPETFAVHLCVHDTGIGIPARDSDYLFESFTQADGSSTRKYSGAGLGLTIARGLAELLGGSVSVQSRLGRGSTFTVSLGFERVLAAPCAQTSPPGLPGAATRVLVVDNDSRRRTRTMDMVRTVSGRVEHAQDGQAALQLVSTARDTEQFAAVVLEYSLPDMNGFALAEQLRAGCPGLRVVLLVSAGLKGDIERCRTAGVAAYLQKPVHAATLCEALRQACAGSAGGVITRYSIEEFMQYSIERDGVAV